VQLPTPVYRHMRRSRAALRTFRARVGVLVAHATTPFTHGPPNWTVYTIFVLILTLIVSVLANIAFLSLFLIATLG